ncbi:helix-turn-helix domain-containing protein [Actinomadura sp. 9N407]|uniref:helix-turn-helix domain-containing protein n=1 Tax=Actinomadura sp. 9N407 TaxID=3375154 RepID=UPI0037A487B6
MAARKPSHELKSFGAEVARLREEAGITRADLSRMVAVSRSYISQVESGNTRCRLDFAERVDNALGTGTAITDAWQKLLRSCGYPKFFADFPMAEASAEFLRAYENTLVYGLLQIEDYARALLIDDATVAARMRRQIILTGDTPPMLCVVLDESVLYRLVGSPDIMRRQCEYLLEVSECGHVKLQIAPIAYYWGVHAPFTLATQQNGDELVYFATTNGGHSSNEAADTLYASKSFATLQAHALSVRESRDLIRKIVSERWS